MSLPEPRHLERLPPAVLPWVYLGFAHLGLVWATATVLVRPELLTGYFYAPRVIALVHAITLGWISSTILGALYMVGPVALRTYFRTSRLDAAACGLYTVGAAGMVSHFWIDSYSGMLWSASMLLVAVVIVAVRVLPGILAAPVDPAVRTAITLAFANLIVAGLWATLIGLEKQGALAVPGSVLPGVWAHAHLAGLGWATMMVLGVGYRLLPMFLPAALPRGRAPLVSVLLLQAGVTGLALALALDLPGAPLFGLLCVAGVALFLALMASRLRHLRPSPRGLPRPDLALGHNLAALLSLAAAAALGAGLLALPAGALELRIAAVYGVVALVGFLSQLIVGVGARLFPLVAWMQSHVRSGFVEPDFSQYDLVDRRLQAAGLMVWWLAVPLLALGVYTAAVAAVRAAAGLLLVGASVEAGLRFSAWRAGRARFTSPEEPSTAPESPPDN